MEEFFIADSEAVGGRKNLIIMVLKDKLEPHELTRELRTYMRKYTYIDVTRDNDLLMKKLRQVMFSVNNQQYT